MSKSSRPKTRNAGQRPRQAQAPKARGGRGKKSAQFQVQLAPVAVGNVFSQGKPRYRNKGQDLVVGHCEYIADIQGSTAVYAVKNTFSLNPGLSSFLPWLSQIASRYESYRFKKLNFLFKTENSTASKGYYAMVPDFDPTDAAPVDKQTALQFHDAAGGAPWNNVGLAIEKANLNKRKSYFVRQGNLLATENLGLYDTGNLFVVAGGNADTSNLGQLWCDYEVELMTPQIDSNFGASDSAKITGGGTMSAAVIFGTTPTQAFSRGLLWTLDSTTGTLTFLQNFQGLLGYIAVGTGLGGMALLIGGTATSSVVQSAGTGGGTTLDAVATVNALAGQTAVLTLNGATTLTTSVLRVGAYQVSL